MAPTPAPAGLGDAGLALWASISDPEDGWKLNAAEHAILERACRVRDRIAALDAQLDAALEADALLAIGDAPDAPARSSLITRGSMGQDVEAPVLVSLAKHDALLQRLLGALKLPDLESGESSTSQAARKAAQARWSQPRTA